MKRTSRPLLLVVSATLLLIAPAPARAAQVFQVSGDAAFAIWFLGDEHKTAGFLEMFDVQVHESGRRPRDFKYAYFQMSQLFCDVTSDEMVRRSFAGYPYAPPEITVARKVESGSLRVSMQLIAFEDRIPRCDEPDLANATSSTFSDIPFDLTASWEGGELLRSKTTFRFDSPTVKVRSNDVAQFRDATATATLAGLDAFGVSRFEGSSVAQLVTFRIGEVFIEGRST